MESAAEQEAIGWAEPPTDLAALRDIWHVYDGQQAAIDAAIGGALAPRPALARKIAELRAIGGSRDTARRLVRDALTRGDWAPYLESLTAQGERYGRAGVPLALWLLLWRLFRIALREHLLAAYGEDAGRISRCLVAAEDWLESSIAVISESYLRQRDATLAEQAAIRELSTPVLVVKPGLLVVPIIGVVDSARAQQLNEQLLASVRAERAAVVVIDVTGVLTMDTVVARYLVRSVEACRLMGARSVLTGLSAGNAQALSQLGVDLGVLITSGDLQDGMREADRLLAQ